MPGLSAPISVDRATLLKKHYQFQHGCFVSEYEQDAGGILAFSSVTPIPMWNHSTWIEGTELDFRRFLERTKHWHRGKNRRPVIYIPELNPAQEAAVRAAGFEEFDREAWMICNTPERTFERDAAVREVSDEKTLRQFIDTFGTSFQVKEAGYQSVLASSNGSSGGRSHHFILLDGQGRAASVGTLVTDGDIGCIYNVGTPAAQRRKGYGRRILEHIASSAKEIGCQILYLQVENNSSAMRLYERCGFQTAFLRVGFRVLDWEAVSIERTRLSNVLGFRLNREMAPGQYLRETRALPTSFLATKANSLHLERICLAAWAYLAHRYTGDQVVSFTVCEHDGSPARGISVKIDPSLIAQQWISSFKMNAPADETEAREVFLCIDREHGANHLGKHEYPLEIHVLARSGTLEIIYRSDLFSKDSIRRMGAHFVNALKGLATHPDARVSEMELLSPEEKHQLLVEWNKSEFQPVGDNIVRLFEARVERNPDAMALIFAQDGQAQPAEQVTYRQLNRKGNRLAHLLQEFGVGPDVFVGICLERCPDLIVSILAVLKAGGACVPLDPSYPLERLRFMIQDTSAPVILTHKALLPLLKGASHAKIICLDDSSSTTASESEKNPSNHSKSESAAYIIFTSGSTGKPKGVVITNYALVNHCLDCCNVYGLSSKDRVLQFSSFNFDAAFEQLFPALISGACVVMRDDEVWNTREFGEKTRDLQLTIADIPTAYWHQLAANWSANPELVPRNRLRLVIVGGEAISPDKVALWHKTPLSHVRLVNAYGPTEATITATSFDIPSPGHGELPFESVPIGRLRGDRKLYVLDPYGSPTPIGVPGELHIGGSMLARGYHRQAELTASRFIPNPFSDDPDSRLYRTGDLVRYLEDGNLEFLGRIDDQVKIRGFRIELGEVEACLNKHLSIRETIVLAKPNSSGEKQLIAYLLPARDIKIPEARAYVRSKLPEYMVPAHFVILEKWPLHPNGKVDRLALPEPAADQEGPLKGPEDPLELQLQLLFERILKRAPIGVDVSFFELGGDSLQALELLVAVEKSTGKQLPLGTLYQSSTVQTLAREVRTRNRGQSWSSLVPLQVSGKRPPLFLLHTTPGDILGYGNLVYRLDQDQPCYGLQSLGLKEAGLSHNSILEMAEYYNSLIRGFQPRGPYYLGGWCYGGVLAVEIARLLKTQGETIGLLALLETVAMPALITNITYHRHRLRCFLKMSPQRWIAYFRGKARYAREWRVANRMRFRQAEDCSDGLRDPRLLQLEHVYNTNLAALNKYRSQYYDGKVTLFNAAEKDPALVPDPHYGWIGLAREIEIHEVPGNHDTMLTEPNVAALARLLNNSLLRAQSIHN
jgi:amino acid adenylation domain-containing protein